MGDEGMSVLRQAEGVLQLSAARQHRLGHRQREQQRLRGIPARAPDRQHGAVHQTGNRVLRAHVDGPVVHKEQVGDVAEPGTGLGVVVGDRLVGHVAAGEDERPV
jgi:hypothetical protein